jgi:hypothetical protein
MSAFRFNDAFVRLLPGSLQEASATADVITWRVHRFAQG